MREKNINYVSHFNKKNYVINFKNLLESSNNIDSHILQDKLFERPDHQFDFLMNFLRAGDVVWDIGAYIGSFAIPFAIEGMQVHAFEGFPSNFERAKINCAPYDNIKIYQCALSNENKKVTSRFGDCTGVDQTPAEIEYFIFDEYVEKRNIPHPRLIKMDIEGMESLALLGMKKILKYVRPIWQIGYHHPGNILLERPEEKIEGYPGFVIPEEGGFDFETFEKMEYHVFDICDAGRPGKFKWGDCNGEYLCVPKEKVTIEKKGEQRFMTVLHEALK